MMKRLAVLATFACLAAISRTNADSIEAVRDVPVRPGVTVRVLIHRAEHDAPLLLLLPGGDGHVFITPDGIVGDKSALLPRVRRMFWQYGLGTVLVDAPTDRQGKAGLGDSRGSDWHARDLVAVAKDVGEGAPLWLVGATEGAVSAANALGRAPDMFVGGVFMSTPTLPARARDVTVFDVDLTGVKQRVLLLFHETDSCPTSPPEMLDRLAFEMTSARVVRAVIGGGLRAGAGPCQELSHHSFFGSEKEAVGAIAQFVTH
jgi:hypothetical protein